MTMIVAFFGLLLLGVPISLIVFIAATAGIAVYSNVGFIITAQQIFNSLSNYVLLAIPLFIMSGSRRRYLPTAGQCHAHGIQQGSGRERDRRDCGLCIFCRNFRVQYGDHCGHRRYFNAGHD